MEKLKEFIFDNWRKNIHVDKRRKVIPLFVVFAMMLLWTGYPLVSDAADAQTYEENEVVTDTSQDDSTIGVDQNVLFISSYAYDWPPVREELSGLENALDRAVNLRVVFMDTRNVDYEKAVSALETTLMVEMEDTRYDCIAVGDDAALQFMLEKGEQYFEGLPVIFFGINSTELADEYEALHEHSTGVIEGYHPEETIRLAQEISPQADRIVVITDNYTSLESSGLNTEDMKSKFPNLGFDILNSSECTCEELKEKLSSFDRSTILCYLSLREDADGHHYNYNETMSLLRDYTNTPVYGLYDTGVGDGLFGGYLISQREMGRMAGKMVMEALNHSSLEEIAMQEVPAHYIFDYELIQKYHIRTGILPDDYIEVNNKDKFLYQYRRTLYIMSAVIAVLVIGILSISAAIRRHRRIRDALETTKTELVEAINRSGLNVWVYYPDEKRADVSFIDEDTQAILRSGLIYDQGRIYMDRFPHTMLDQHFIHPDDESKMLECYSRMDSGSEQAECDYRALRGGIYIWEHMILNKMPASAGRRIVIGTASNIQEKSVLQGVMENTINHDYDFIALVSGQTEQMNIFQRSRNAEIGLARLNIEDMKFDRMREELIASMIPAEDMMRLLKETQLREIRNVLLNQRDYTIYFTTKSGQRKKQRYTYLDHRTGDIIVTETDITNAVKKEAETNEKLQKALKEAEAATKSKSDFFSRVSHDMRTPLNGIISFADFALESNDAEEKQQFIQKIRMSSDILLGLINHTLEISRFESGTARLELIKLNGKRLLDDLATVVRTNAESKNQDFYYESEIEEDEVFLTDKLRMQELCLNLLSNAVKYSPPGGRVEFAVHHVVNTKEHPYDLQIIVRDNGIGIAEDMIDTIFEPFVQEHIYDEQGIATGTGLGLSIVKKIVDLMGGDITLESIKNEGSTFTVYLPMQITREDLKEKHENPNDYSMLRGMKVLLCEDSDLNAEIAQRLFTKMGMEMDHAPNGQQGLEMFLQSAPGHYSAIFMDVHMPVMGGLETTSMIRRSEHPDAARIPIIAMTADAYEEDVRKCLSAGMNAHLAKPIQPVKLFRTLMRQLYP